MVVPSSAEKHTYAGANSVYAWSLSKGDLSPERSGSVLITFHRKCQVVDLSRLLRPLLFEERCRFYVRNHLLFCCLKQLKKKKLQKLLLLSLSFLSPCVPRRYVCASLC